MELCPVLLLDTVCSNFKAVREGGMIILVPIYLIIYLSV